VLLAKVYPEYDWLPWKFPKVPQKFWDDVKNQRKFMEWAEKQLHVTDWHKVSHQVKKMNKKQLKSGLNFYRRAFPSFKT
jgi:hypothetical protein